MRICTLPAALIAVGATAFQTQSVTLRTALAMVSDDSDVLERLLNGGHSVVAARLAGAFRNIGREQIANSIVETMRAAGYVINEHDPFVGSPQKPVSLQARSVPVNRLSVHDLAKYARAGARSFSSATQGSYGQGKLPGTRR